MNKFEKILRMNSGLPMSCRAMFDAQRIVEMVYKEYVNKIIKESKLKFNHNLEDKTIWYCLMGAYNLDDFSELQNAAAIQWILKEVKSRFGLKYFEQMESYSIFSGQLSRTVIGRLEYKDSKRTGRIIPVKNPKIKRRLVCSDHKKMYLYSLV